MANPLTNIDWQMLRDQKKSLLFMIDVAEELHTPHVAENLMGILHLIDSLQDYAVDEMGFAPEDVFMLGRDDGTEE